MQNIIMSTVQIAIGGGIAYYGYTSAMTPTMPTMVPPPVTNAVNTMMGGVRKMLGKRKH